MNRKHVRAVLLCLVLSCLAIGQPSATVSADEEAIRARAADFAAGWNKHDAKAMAALWAEDGDFIDPFGRVAVGRAEIEKLLAENQAGLMEHTTYSLTVKSINLLRPDVAVATWDGSVSGMKAHDGSKMPALTHIVTVVVMKQDGKWWTVAARALAPVPAGFPPPPPAKGK